MAENKEAGGIRMITNHKELFKNHAFPGVTTNEWRAMFHYKMGWYDSHHHNTIPIETMFMYLFRRFGPPVLPYDDYKSLFDYGFKVGNTVFTLHGSYHEHVYLNVGISKAEIKAYDKTKFEKWKPWIDGILQLLADNKVLPYLDRLYKVPLGRHSKAFNKVWAESLRKELGEEHWECIKTTTEEEDEKDPVKQAAMEAVYESHSKRAEELQAQYRKDHPAPVTYPPNAHHDGIKKVMSWLSENFPGTFKDMLAFVREMKTATYTRDVYFNLAGYENVPSKETPDWEHKYMILDAAITDTYGISHCANMMKARLEGQDNMPPMEELVGHIIKAVDGVQDTRRVGSKRNPFPAMTDYTDYTTIGKKKTRIAGGTNP